MYGNYQYQIRVSALTALSGVILSGPAGFLMVRILSPQPEWAGSGTFSENYNTIQDIPYYFGFLLIGGMLMLVSAHYLACNKENNKTKFKLLVSLGSTIIFCTLIAFNYLCQSGFVHQLALHYKPEYDTAISTFSMSNPGSLGWVIEMFGYGVLGVSTWLLASFYKEKHTLIYRLLIINGIISVSGAVGILINKEWILSRTGLILYFAWNLLMIWLTVLIYLQTKKHSKIS